MRSLKKKKKKKKQTKKKKKKKHAYMPLILNLSLSGNKKVR